MNNPTAAPSDIIEIFDDNDSDTDKQEKPRDIRETRSSKSATNFAARKLKELREEGGMATFNPDKSLRERKKISKVVQATQGRRKNNFRALYSPTGIFLETGQDLCDCLEESCTGCFYPCPKCNGSKCGQTCRRRRNWFYDNVVIDGQSQSTVRTDLSELLRDC